MGKNVQLTAYGQQLIGADVDQNMIDMDELEQLITPEESEDGELSLVVDGRDVLYNGELVGKFFLYSGEQIGNKGGRVSSGTAPDTSLWLGAERKAWLTSQGGIQPTIHRLIDEAMSKS
jgi:hypothetical protein